MTWRQERDAQDEAVYAERMGNVMGFRDDGICFRCNEVEAASQGMCLGCELVVGRRHQAREAEAKREAARRGAATRKRRKEAFRA